MASKEGHNVKDVVQAVQDEQRWQDTWWQWSSDELKRLTEQIQRLHSARSRDIGAVQRLHTNQRSMEQLQTMIELQDPCFARIRARICTSDGEETVSLHIHNYSYSQNVGPDQEWNISHLTGLADLVRDPNLTQIRIDPDGPYRNQVIPIKILESTVEDIALGPDHRVMGMAPRHGLIWEDRVRARLNMRAQSALDVLSDVLNPEQSKLVNTAPGGRRGLILTGCAGSGKTVVAAHLVAVQFRHQAGWYLVPTPALGASIAPVLPRLGLTAGHTRVLTVEELLHELWPELVSKDWHPEDAPRNARDNAWKSIKEATDPAAWRNTARTVFEETQQRKHEALAALNTSIIKTVRNSVDHLSPSTENTLSLLGVWDRTQGDDYLQTVYLHLEGLADIQQAPLLRYMGIKTMLQRALNDHELDWRTLYETVWRRWGAAYTTVEYLSGPPTSEDVPALLWFAAEFGRRPDTLPQWVIVDEAQQVPMRWMQALQQLIPDAYCVFSGDTMQGWQPQHTDLNHLVTELKMTVEQLPRLALTHSFRIPERLFEAAEQLRQRSNGVTEPATWVPYHPDAGLLQVVRQASDQTLRERLKDQLTAWHQTGIKNIAIIVPTTKIRNSLKRYLGNIVVTFTGDKPYQGGAIVTTLSAVAGLEFDAVSVYGGEIDDYPSGPIGARKLYTAITRSRRAVTCFLVVDPGMDQRLATTRKHIEQQYLQAIKDADIAIVGTNRYGEVQLRSASQRRKLRQQAEDEKATRLEKLKDGLAPQHHPSPWFDALGV